MKGKHRNRLVHAFAAIARDRLRARIASSMNWSALVTPQEGCTAIVGVCSRLPRVLIANLKCLANVKWPALKRVLLVVDCERQGFPPEIEQETLSRYAELKPEFFYYSAEQSALAETLKLPFVYSWLSWCIALRHTVTSTVLFHDYDALLLTQAIADRYETFTHSNAKIQGISWYQANGLEKNDRLATTFEAFISTAWLRSFPPVELFNKLRVVDNRSIDFDTTLDLQHRKLRPHERTIAPMSQQDLVHPSQMIHQFTMFRRHPGAPLPCFSIPMIPFFNYVGGDQQAIVRATEALKFGQREKAVLLSDTTQINFALLDVKQVDWALKQIVQTCVSQDLKPNKAIYAYGEELYRTVKAKPELVWRGDFTGAQRAWINQASNQHPSLMS